MSMPWSKINTVDDLTVWGRGRDQNPINPKELINNWPQHEGRYTWEWPIPCKHNPGLMGYRISPTDNRERSPGLKLCLNIGPDPSREKDLEPNTSKGPMNKDQNLRDCTGICKTASAGIRGYPNKAGLWSNDGHLLYFLNGVACQLKVNWNMNYKEYRREARPIRKNSQKICSLGQQATPRPKI
jgi:hypothetical protein